MPGSIFDLDCPACAARLVPELGSIHRCLSCHVFYEVCGRHLVVRDDLGPPIPAAANADRSPSLETTDS